MKAKVNRQVLIQALNQISVTFATNTKAPQKDSVYITAADNQLKIQSVIQQFNLGVVSTLIPAVVETEGETFVFGKKLLSLLKLMSGEFITLDTSLADGNNIAVSDGKSNYQFSGIKFDIQAIDNPTKTTEVQSQTTQSEFALDVNDFKSAVDKVIDNTENFGYLGYTDGLKVAVNFTIKENTMTLQATNRHKLSKIVCKVDNLDNISTEFNLYNITLETVLKIVKSYSRITFCVDGNAVIFKTDNLTITTSQIKNFTFPDSSRFFSSNGTTSAVVDTKEFVHAVKSSAIIAKDNPEKAIYLHFSKDVVEIRSYSIDGKSSWFVHADDVQADAEIIITLKPLDVINKITTKYMRIEVYSNERLYITDENGIDKHIACGTRCKLEKLKESCPFADDNSNENTLQIEPPTVDVTAEIAEIPAQVTRFEIGKAYTFETEGISENVISAEFTATNRTDTTVTFASSFGDEIIMDIRTDNGIEKISNPVWEGSAENSAA